MDSFDVKTVVAIGGSAYGVGATMEQAKKNLLRQSLKEKVRAWRFYGCEAKELTFECGVDLTILSPKGTQCARLAVP